MTERKGWVVTRLEAGAEGRSDKPVWVHVATAGTYKGYAGGDMPFTFDLPVFKQIVANVRRHPSFRLGSNGVGNKDVIAWDFHHASEMPAASVGTLGAPAQGWIQDAEVRIGADGRAELWVLTRWLEPARSYIKEGRYQWASVSVLFDAVDAITGVRVGPTLTSVAITNQPFIEGMQPLAASRNAPAHSPKGKQNMAQSQSLETRVIARARELRGTTPTVALALSTAAAQLMPNATNEQRHAVWAPLLKRHNLETVRHAASKGAQLARKARR
ncbi:MAG TPA: phage protease [Polyangiaceae bacterium]|nr:phage protease [Polyangiaceae bacterium]